MAYVEFCHRNAPRAGIVAVVLLVVLAGCGGFVPGLEDGGTERGPYTVEEGQRPSANDSTDSGPDVLAPGLTTEGVENESLLFDQHFSHLERASRNGTYRIATWYNRTVDGTLDRATRERHVVQYPERRYRSTTEVTDASTGTSERWVEADHALLRTDHPAEPASYTAFKNGGQPEHPRKPREQLSEVLYALGTAQENATVTERVRNDTTVYVVNLPTETHTSATRTTYTVHIRADGFVTQYSTRSVYEEESGQTTLVEVDRSFETTPHETLERPDWYDEALEATADDETANETGYRKTANAPE